MELPQRLGPARVAGEGLSGEVTSDSGQDVEGQCVTLFRGSALGRGTAPRKGSAGVAEG